MTRALPTNVRVFRSSGAAYDACMTDEAMTFGTIFMVPSEQIVGIAWAWPVAVTLNGGHLHALEGDSSTARLDFEVAQAVPVAAALALAVGWDLASFVSCMGLGFDLP